MPKFVLTESDIPTTMDQAIELHKKFKSHFGKQYDTPDEEKRAIVHLGNAAQRVVRLNAESAQAGSSVQYEINEFSDMSPMDIKRMLTYKPPPT